MVKEWKFPSVFALLLPDRFGVNIYTFHCLTATDILQRLVNVGGPLLQEPTLMLSQRARTAWPNSDFVS